MTKKSNWSFFGVFWEFLLKIGSADHSKCDFRFKTGKMWQILLSKNLGNTHFVTNYFIEVHKDDLKISGGSLCWKSLIKWSLKKTKGKARSW